MQPYSSIDTTAAWEKLRFILSVRSDSHMIDSLLIAVHAFVSRVSMSFSVDSTLLPRYVNLSTSLSGVTWCRLFNYSTYIPFCVHWHGGQCLQLLVPKHAIVFRLVWVYLPYRYVIGVVGVGNCFCRVPSASFLCQLEDIFSDFINRCSKHVILTDDKEV